MIGKTAPTAPRPLAPMVVPTAPTQTTITPTKTVASAPTNSPESAATYQGGGTAAPLPKKSPSTQGALQLRTPPALPPRSTWGGAYKDAGRFGSALVPPALLEQAGAASASRPLQLQRDAFTLDTRTGRPHVQLHVTSTKDLKVQPALAFVVATLQRLWPEFSADDVTVHPHKTDSGVAEQPWGLDGGLQGAAGRAADGALREQVNAQADAGGNVFIVSLENTVAPVALPKAHMPHAWRREHAHRYLDAEAQVGVDVAALHVELFAGGAHQVTQGFSAGVTVPRAFVDRSRGSGTSDDKRSGFDLTAGSFIASTHGLPGDDWHKAFVGLPRATILTEGLLALPVTTSP